MTDGISAEPAAASLVREATAEVGALVRDLRAFQDRIETRMKTQEDRIAMIDRKSAQRPALEAAAAETAPHRKAVSAYLRTGDETGLRGLTVERKGLVASVAAEGGYLVDQETAGRIASILRGAGSLRAVANVAQVEAGTLEVLIETAELASAWISEGTTPAETDAGAIQKISIPLHELAAMPRASQRLLDDSAFDIEGWLAERIAETFSRAENAAFVNGDGVDKPRGFLTYPTTPADAWTWGALGYIPTGAAGGFDTTDPADALVDLVYSLGARYRRNAVFAMNSKTAGAVRKMKDAEGRFLWSESVSADQPARLMGYPVLTVEDMPDIATDSFAIAFGDFRAGYTVVERPDLRILRDPYSAKPHVQFYASARIGGDVTDTAAIRLLKFGVS